jgi:glycerate 2-kinase
MHLNGLMTKSMRSSAWGERISRVLAAALQAVEPSAAVNRFMQRNGDQLCIDGQSYDLSRFKRVLMVGAGKAGAPMAAATANLLGDSLSKSVIIIKEGYENPEFNRGSEELHPGLLILEAGHPLPDRRGVKATHQIIELLESTQPDDLVLCLISGGGSALMTAPIQGISLNELQALTSELLGCGATINEINSLRKHLDQVKGGRLAQLTSPAKVAALILSDVVGNHLDVIASGPTVPDITTFQDAYEVLERNKLIDKVPAAITDHLRRGLHGEIPDTPKPGDPIFDQVQNVIIGSNFLAAEAAVKEAKENGFNPLLLTTYLQGEARLAGYFLASIARQIADTGQPVARPACLVVGGETTVTLHGDGLGGRNQELALGAAAELDGLKDIALVSLATDGGDGPTDAAGAVVTGDTLQHARIRGLDSADYLSRNDAYHFFEQLGDLLKTGPTQTNVNDLTFIFAF